MSIKSEIRLIESVAVPITNGSFLKGVDGWVGTGTTADWVHGSFNNTIRKISGNTTKLSQTVPVSGFTVTTSYFPNSKAYRVDYVILGQQSGFTFTPKLGGTEGTTRTENGTYYDIFYVGDSNLLLVDDDTYYSVNYDQSVDTSDRDYLIWG